MRLYPLLIIFIISACNKGDSGSSTKDWKVKYEVISETTGDLVLVQWSNGVNTYMTGTTMYQTWPMAPWVKDTIFKAVDGDRVIGLNVVSSVNSGPSNITGEVTSRIYINGKIVKEARGINQFLKTGLR